MSCMWVQGETSLPTWEKITDEEYDIGNCEEDKYELVRIDGVVWRDAEVA